MAHRNFARAHAKINLTLDIIGKRPDGYHDLASIMQTVALYDTILLQDATRADLSCFCDVPDLNTFDNLAVRAAQALRAETQAHQSSLRLEIHKDIPFQAGMGGGSSDAAEVLVALNSLWNPGLSEERLRDLGARLGSDVPFFIRGGTQLIEGRGEVVTPLPDVEPFWLILAHPPVPVPTPLVFRNLSPDEWTDGANTRAIAEEIRLGHTVPWTRLDNALERTAFRLYPAIQEMRDELVRAGAKVVRMSGSGPTLFAPFEDLERARDILTRARAAGIPVRLTRTVSAEELRACRATLHP